MSDMSAYGGSVYAAQIDAPARPQLAVEIDVDACIIGAGLAGLTVARELARRGWSVAVLEARRIAWNASGRNTGFVLPGFAAEEDAIIERVGLDHAKALWSLSEQGAEYVRNTVRELDMPGVDLVEDGWLNVWKSDDDARVAHLAEFYAKQFDAEVEHWPKERVRETLRSNRYFSALNFPRGFAINPLAYAQGLAAAAEAAGARIFENTPALDIDPAGVRKRITTPQARVRAGQVIFAGNTHIGLLMPKLAATLVPCSTYAIATEPLGAALHDAIRTQAAVSDTEFVDNHYRIVDGDRLVWCGRCTLWEGDPRSFTKSLLRDIRRTFPQLGDVKAAHAWTGTLGNTVHLMPQIGETMPGVWLLSGFSGHHFAINQYLFQRMPFDAERDLAAPTLSYELPNVAVVAAKHVPATTLKEFIEWAKAKPNGITIGSPGPGTTPHLSGVLFAARTGVQAVHVPFKGASETIPAMLAGDVNFAVDNLASYVSQIESGNMRALAVTSASRWPTLPNVPTMGEAGVKDFVVTSWAAYVLPKGTPRAVIDKINAAHKEIAADDATQKRFLAAGGRLLYSTPEEASAFAAKERTLWQEIIKLSGLQPQ